MSMICSSSKTYSCTLMIHVLCTNEKKDIGKIEKILNENFENICGWFDGNIFFDSLHFGDNKTKSILFTSKKRANNLLNKYKIQRNKYKTASTRNTSWICFRRVNVWWIYGIKVYKQNKRELKFLYKKIKFLTPELRKMLCSMLISHILFACAQLSTQILAKKN